MAGEKSYGVTALIDGDAIGGLQDVQIDGVSVEIIDMTEHRTGVDALKGWREKKGGLKDPGNITILANYKEGDVGQESWRDQPGETLQLVVTLSTGDILTVDVIVGAFQLSNPIEGKIPLTMSATCTGVPAWT